MARDVSPRPTCTYRGVNSGFYLLVGVTGAGSHQQVQYDCLLTVVNTPAFPLFSFCLTVDALMQGRNDATLAMVQADFL